MSGVPERNISHDLRVRPVKIIPYLLSTFIFSNYQLITWGFKAIFLLNYVYLQKYSKATLFKYTS